MIPLEEYMKSSIKDHRIHIAEQYEINDKLYSIYPFRNYDKYCVMHDNVICGQFIPESEHPMISDLYRYLNVPFKTGKFLRCGDILHEQFWNCEVFYIISGTAKTINLISLTNGGRATGVEVNDSDKITYKEICDLLYPRMCCFSYVGHVSTHLEVKV